MATVVGTLCVVVVGGTLFYILLMMVGIGRFVAPGYVYGLFFVAGIVVIPPLFFEIRKKAYAHTFFKFYDTYMDFQFFQFFISRRQGRVHYSDVADIFQQASALQEQRGLITVSLFVPALIHHRGPFAGVRLRDLPLAENYLQRVMEIVGKGRRVMSSGDSPTPP